MAVQIVVDETAKASRCAGLPPALRALHRAAAEFPGSRCVLDQASVLPVRYPVQAAQARVDELPLKPHQPLLALAGDGFPDEGALDALSARGEACAGVHDGRVVAVWLPGAGALAEGEPGEAARAALGYRLPQLPIGWTDSRDRSEALAAEDALCARLAKDTDGYIAKLDRRVSISLSRTLLPFPVATPNAITTASLVLGLLGCWWLASGKYPFQVAGILLLWFCCILDGCDGEVARLKLLCSPSGAAYDLWADHLAHLATFVAIPVAVHRARPDVDFTRPGALLVLGFLGCMFSVWWLVLRLPEERRGPYATLIERVASRDYVYLLVVLVLIRRLEWFLWTASVGSHVFYLALWALSVRRDVIAPGRGAVPAGIPEPASSAD